MDYKLPTRQRPAIKWTSKEAEQNRLAKRMRVSPVEEDHVPSGNELDKINQCKAAFEAHQSEPKFQFVKAALENQNRRRLGQISEAAGDEDEVLAEAQQGSMGAETNLIFDRRGSEDGRISSEHGQDKLSTRMARKSASWSEGKTPENNEASSPLKIKSWSTGTLSGIRYIIQGTNITLHSTDASDGTSATVGNTDNGTADVPQTTNNAEHQESEVNGPPREEHQEPEADVNVSPTEPESKDGAPIHNAAGRELLKNMENPRRNLQEPVEPLFAQNDGNSSETEEPCNSAQNNQGNVPCHAPFSCQWLLPPTSGCPFIPEEYLRSLSAEFADCRPPQEHIACHWILPEHLKPYVVTSTVEQILNLADYLFAEFSLVDLPDTDDSGLDECDDHTATGMLHQIPELQRLIPERFLRRAASMRRRVSGESNRLLAFQGVMDYATNCRMNFAGSEENNFPTALGEAFYRDLDRVNAEGRRFILTHVPIQLMQNMRTSVVCFDRLVAMAILLLRGLVEKAEEIWKEAGGSLPRAEDDVQDLNGDEASANEITATAAVCPSELCSPQEHQKHSCIEVEALSKAPGTREKENVLEIQPEINAQCENMTSGEFEPRITPEVLDVPKTSECEDEAATERSEECRTYPEQTPEMSDNPQRRTTSENPTESECKQDDPDPYKVKCVPEQGNETDTASENEDESETADEEEEEEESNNSKKDDDEDQDPNGDADGDGEPEKEEKTHDEDKTGSDNADDQDNGRNSNDKDDDKQVENESEFDTTETGSFASFCKDCEEISSGIYFKWSEPECSQHELDFFTSISRANQPAWKWSDPCWIGAEAEINGETDENNNPKDVLQESATTEESNNSMSKGFFEISRDCIHVYEGTEPATDDPDDASAGEDCEHSDCWSEVEFIADDEIYGATPYKGEAESKPNHLAIEADQEAFDLEPFWRRVESISNTAVAVEVRSEGYKSFGKPSVEASQDNDIETCFRSFWNWIEKGSKGLAPMPPCKKMTQSRMSDDSDSDFELASFWSWCEAAQTDADQVGPSENTDSDVELDSFWVHCEVAEKPEHMSDFDGGIDSEDELDSFLKIFAVNTSFETDSEWETISEEELEPVHVCKPMIEMKRKFPTGDTTTDEFESDSDCWDSDSWELSSFWQMCDTESSKEGPPATDQEDGEVDSFWKSRYCEITTKRPDFDAGSDAGKESTVEIASLWGFHEESTSDEENESGLDRLWNHTTETSTDAERKGNEAESSDFPEVDSDAEIKLNTKWSVISVCNWSVCDSPTGRKETEKDLDSDAPENQQRSAKLTPADELEKPTKERLYEPQVGKKSDINSDQCAHDAKDDEAAGYESEVDTDESDTTLVDGELCDGPFTEICCASQFN